MKTLVGNLPLEHENKDLVNSCLAVCGTVTGMRKAQQKSMDLLWQKAEVQNKQSLEQMTRGFVCTVRCEESWLSTLVIRVGALFGSPALPPCSHVVRNQSHLSAHQRRSR